VEIGVDSLKIEGRTKSPYYVARACQAYRAAIDDAVAGRPLDPKLLGRLDGLANRGYTDGFYQRHTPAEYQNYLSGHSESGRSLYVGDIVGYDAGRDLVEFVAKNKLSVGDRVELIQPAGIREYSIAEMRNASGNAIVAALGSGHRAWLRLPADSVGAFVARFVQR
jgi:putative protease